MKRETIVSIRNLHEVTEMEVLEFITAHLLSQRKMCYEISKNGQTICKYRHGDLRCAAGCLIPDEDYSKSFEGLTWEAMVSGGAVPSNHKWVITETQLIHDVRPVESWPLELEKLKYKVERRAQGFAIL